MAKKKKKEKCAPLALWLVTFSDLMTLLLTFFVLLLTMASMDNAILTTVTLTTADLGLLEKRGSGRVNVKERMVIQLMNKPWEVLNKKNRIKDLLYPDDILPALRRHLDAHGFRDIDVTPTRMAGMRATRSDPTNEWVQRALASVNQTLGDNGGGTAALIPNIGGGIPNDIFAEDLDMPTVWIPHSYAGCNQHAPNEHMLASVAREGLQIMAGLFWDIGDPGATILV